MPRSLWSLVAMIGCSFACSGCAMCEHCLDYDYPAFGGCCDWHADDHCRAGSAFCGMHGPSEFDVPPGAVEYADPVPGAPNSVTTTPAEERPPADLAPPSGRRMRPSGNDPLPGAAASADETPALPDLDLPAADDAPIPDPFDR